LVNVAKADMIDFWHVMYNDFKIKEFHDSPNEKINEIIININEIKKTDTLTITYFRDVYYIDCKAKIEVEDCSKNVIAVGTTDESRAPIKISVFELLLNARTKPFFAYYYDCVTRGREGKLLFRVIFTIED
jgi:hypothetical protein